MKSRPILFKGEMVRALLDGRKTQTRRIVDPQPVVTADEAKVLPEAWASGFIDVRCPYGKPGDRLWVKETWRIGAWNEDGGEIAVDYLADNFSRREWLQVPEADDFEKYWLQCCDDCDKAGVKTDEDGKYHWEPGQSPCRIRPSIFMPRWASRITLEITNVRVERLQDISEADAIAEGMQAVTTARALHGESLPPPAFTQYADLWESINGPGSWDANPWVWVIEFKRVAQ